MNEVIVMLDLEKWGRGLVGGIRSIIIAYKI